MTINADVETDPNHKQWRMASAMSRIIDRAEDLLSYMEGYEKDWNSGEPLPAFEGLRKAITEGKKVVGDETNKIQMEGLEVIKNEIQKHETK